METDERWYWVAGLSMVAIILLAILYGAAGSEYAECVKWKDQAGQYPGYYITQWQADQCNANGVQIEAPIK